MSIIHLVLIILALICFLFAALGPWGVTPPRGNLVAAGLFLWLLATLVKG